MVDLLAMIKEKWGSVEGFVLASGILDANGIKDFRNNLIVDGEAVGWQAHAKLVTGAVEEADKLVQTIKHQAGLA